jgi:DNA-directed RNA polymerase specialized sigma24 family protein
MWSMATKSISEVEGVNKPSKSELVLPRMAYTMRETAAILGVEYHTVHRLCARGLIHSSGGLRTKLFATTEIERFLKATMQ